MDFVARTSGAPDPPGNAYASRMVDNPLAGLGRRLQAIREELNFGQAQMAEWLGVGRTRYVNWEREENRPAEEKMVWLCEQTGITLDYIYRGKLDALPMALGIRLRARELGQSPEQASSDLPSLVQAALRASQKA
jgi:transcriptional regulator with XRE-family HTH domain